MSLMRRLRTARRGSSALDYAGAVAIAAAALVVMAVPIKRALMGQYRAVGDTFGHERQYGTEVDAPPPPPPPQTCYTCTVKGYYARRGRCPADGITGDGEWIETGSGYSPEKTYASWTNSCSAAEAQAEALAGGHAGGQQILCEWSTTGKYAENMRAREGCFCRPHDGPCDMN